MKAHIVARVIGAIVLATLYSSTLVYAASNGRGEAGISNDSGTNPGAPIYGGKPINGGLIKLTTYSKITGTVVTFSTPDSYEKVCAFYKHAVPKNAEVEVTSATATLKYKKNDGSHIDIEINKYPGHTNYTISHTYKP